jgi:hypothetical protein
MPSSIKVAHARQTFSNKPGERHGARMVHSRRLLTASFMARPVNSTGRTKSLMITATADRSTRTVASNASPGTGRSYLQSSTGN